MNQKGGPIPPCHRHTEAKTDRVWVHHTMDYRGGGLQGHQDEGTDGTRAATGREPGRPGVEGEAAAG